MPTTTAASPEALGACYRLAGGEPYKLVPWVNPKPMLDDAELLRRAATAQNSDAIRRLWEGEVTGYKSQNEADLALCRLLAFWTGPDPERIDRLFRQSELMRPKWDQRRGTQTDGQRTILKALCSLEQSPPIIYPSTPSWNSENSANSAQPVYDSEFAAFHLQGVSLEVVEQLLEQTLPVKGSAWRRKLFQFCRLVRALPHLAACAAAGTDYLALRSEPAWRRRMRRP